MSSQFQLITPKHASSDFVGDFMTFTEGRISPRLFRQWSGIALVAGALERRVWAKVGPYIVYPNLYTFLVGAPGVGKSVIEIVRKLWTDARAPDDKRAFHVAPDQMTKAALIDTLADSLKTFPRSANIYHSLLIAAEELSVFLPTYDGEFIATLISIWNNKDLHHEKRRHGPATNVSIDNPQINLLAGVQPAWLGETFPETAWSSGIGRRLIMVYSSEKPLIDIFAEPDVSVELRNSLLERLGQMSQLHGQIMWEREAADHVSAWHMTGGQPVPKHSKLAQYVETRTEFVEKLAIVSAVARTGKLIIRIEDAHRAIEWLTDVERVMPDIFRAMIGRSDAQVLEELYLFALSMWGSKHTPVPNEAVWRFLAERVPSEKIDKLIQTCQNMGALRKDGDTWTPLARQGYGAGVE
jgi:hypothetical protein